MCKLAAMMTKCGSHHGEQGLTDTDRAQHFESELGQRPAPPDEACPVGDAVSLWRSRLPTRTYNVPAPTSRPSATTVSRTTRTPLTTTTSVPLTHAPRDPTTAYIPSSTCSTAKTASRSGVRDVSARRLSRTTARTACLRCPAATSGAKETGTKVPNTTGPPPLPDHI